MAERTSIDTRPVYTNFVKSYAKHKTKDGYSLDSAYYKRYYSSLDAEIYFGNEFVEEVVAINWNISQGQIPMFGFNSYVYDEIALGARFIQGQFAINFISPNYLFTLLNIAKADSITNMGQYVVNKTVKESTVTENITDGTKGIALDDHSSIWKDSFDIDVIFGNKTKYGTPAHIILEGVMIKDSRMELNLSGEPVAEMYSFIAKDIKTIV